MNKLVPRSIPFARAEDNYFITLELPVHAVLCSQANSFRSELRTVVHEVFRALTKKFVQLLAHAQRLSLAVRERATITHWLLENQLQFFK